MTKDFFEKRLSDLVNAYDSQVERLHNTAGAIQEVRFTLQKFEEGEKKNSKRGAKKK
ncbi:MAG: hypothetical protein IMZ53_15730 [Thermoplasmata archaeon]|nr:hypothetical protein [Thermoplasmata archaeon]